MKSINTVGELKAAIDLELAAKATEIENIFQKEFPGVSLEEMPETTCWGG